MNLFADYIQPFTGWLQQHPNWALFITFFIAMAESLAIIGSIVPGSVTMTAIGILAGSGIMRIDLTLIASTLGAVCGDSLSYALGYFYSDKLIYIWPFKKYPQWLKYGKDFFSRHGGKSVLIGRFVGPLRSIIPVIAGIMHMKQWRFLTANFISAVGWSLLYVMPGVLIGAAGHELSAESATRLFVIILLALLLMWLFSLGIKWSIVKLHSFLKNNLHGFWTNFKDKPYIRKVYQTFTPLNEVNHYPTAGLFILLLLNFLGALTLILLSAQQSILKNLDVPVHLFLQSSHTYLLKIVAIVCTQLTSTMTLALVYIFCCLWFLYNKKIQAALYLSFLVIISGTLGYFLSLLIYYPRPQGLLLSMAGSSFPNTNLLIATTLYGFIFFYINNKYSLLTGTLRSIILILLGLSGLGAIYLGDYWLSNVLTSYFIGSFLCLTVCILYRKDNLSGEKKFQSVIILTILLASIIVSSLASLYINFNSLVYAHTPYNKEYILDDNAWWDQKKPILPLYRLNRVGKLSSLLNLQYSGTISQLKSSLEKEGWESHDETAFEKMLILINRNPDEVRLPLLTQLYQNKKPSLLMSYVDKKKKLILQLTLWDSNYNLKQSAQPLWIGTFHSNIPDRSVPFFSYLIPALDNFTLRKVTLSEKSVKISPNPIDPYLILIKSNRASQ